MARTGSTCRALRAALLGPDSASLWSWTYLGFVVGPAARLPHHQRQLRFLLSQAHHARGALVTISPGAVPQIQAAAPQLAAMQELMLLGCDAHLEAACLFTALGSQLTRLEFTGSLPTAELSPLSGLRFLRLKPPSFFETGVRSLASALPQLQCCELHLVGGCLCPMQPPATGASACSAAETAPGMPTAVHAPVPGAAVGRPAAHSAP